MPVGDSSDWPPPGWTEDVKATNGRKIKYYTNVETGKKFYSKKEVTRYMNTKETCPDVTQAMNDQDKSCSENNVSQMNNQDKSCSEKNARQMNNQDKSCSGKNISQMNNQDKSCSENNVSQTVGEPNNAHEWLPLGWIVELKTRKSGSHAGTTYKVYIEPSTGNKFYSKPEVSKYLKTMEQNNIAEGQIHGNGEVSSSNQKIPEDSKSIKGGGQSRKSKRQKSDTDQAAHGVEEESVSKKKASQDPEDVGEQRRISNRKKSGTNRRSTKTSSHGAGEDFPLNEKTSLGSKENSEQSPLSKRQKPGSDSPSAKSVSSVAGDSDSVDEFPPGWKKEFIIQENDRGTRKDLVYTDPVHGYKFRSKEEVLCYLQTGDASRCARRPAKRNVASTTKDDSPMTDDASLKKSGCFMTGRQLFATDELKGAKSFGTCSPAQQVESSKKQFDCSVSDPNTIISSILAEINENHSIENVIEDADIETVKVGVTHPSAVSTKSDLLPEKQLLENEQEKLRHKAAKKQSRKSKTTESLNLGRRASKRLAGQNPEAEAANLDLGERALPLIVEKSSSPSLSMNVCRQELLQDSDPTPETGNSDQVSLNGEASLDELPPGWKKEIKITKKANGIRKDPLYIDPVHGYVLRSKKDVFRYLQTGDINSCAIRPVKRDKDATMKESSPTAAYANSKKLECSVTERQPLAAKESRGRKRSDTCSPEIQAKSSKKQPESGESNANLIVTSSAADIYAKHSDENVIENAGIRDSSADRKVIAAQSDAIKKLSAVSTPPSDLTPEQQLPENEHEKHINKEKLEQSRRSRTKKPITPGRRISKRLVGHSPEPVADLNLGERAFRAVVKKSASLDIPLNVSAQEFSQNKDPALGTGSFDQASLNREASGNEFPPDREREIPIQNIDPTVGSGNSDQASLSRDASGDELSPGLEKEMLAQNKDPTVGTGNSDQASLSREASGDERLEKETLAQNKDATVGTGDSDQASLNREASGDKLWPGLEKEMLAQNKDLTVGAGNSDQASLSREASGDKLPRGLEMEMLAQNKDPTVGADNSDQASVSREASRDKLLPGLEKEMLAQNKDPTVGTGNSDRASLSRKASGNELSPGLEKEMLARSKDRTVGTGNSDQASLSRKASGNELSPGLGKEMLSQSKDRTVGTGNSDQASLSRKASGNELSPGLKKEMLAESKDRTVGTGNSDQASLSRKASGNELSPGLEKEMLTQNKNWTVGTGNSNLASLSTKASLEEIPPGWENEILRQKKYPTVGTGISGRVSLSRKLSPDEIPPGWENVIPPGWKNELPAHASSLGEIPPGWEKEILAYNKVPTIRTGNSDQASLSRKLASADDLPPGWEKEMITRNKVLAVGTGNSLDDIPPGWEKELLFQTKNPKVGTGNSNQSYLSREASVDELPPGWTMEFRMRKNARGKDPYYTNPMHEYVFRSKKDVMRYLQTGDIRSCAVRPTKRDPYSTMKDDSPSTHDTSSKILGCSLTGSQLSATEESKGRKCSATRSLALHAESSNEHHESTVFNLNTSISSTVADITDKHSCENVNEDANIGVSMRSRKMKNSKSSTPVRRVSKRLSRQNQEMVADIDPGERAVVNNSASSGLPLDASGGELAQQPDLATGDSDQPSLRRKASSRDDPLKAVKYLSEGQPFKEQKVVNGLTSEKQNDEIILRGSQPARISCESRKFHSEHQAVKESPTEKPGNEVQDGQYRLLNNSRPVELASGRMVFPVEDQYVSERSTIEQVSEKRDYENRQWQDSQLAEPSWRSVDLNVENQQWQYSQLAPSQRSVDLNVENQQWQYAQLAPSRKSVDLNVENQQWQYSQLAPYSQPAPSRGSVDLNVKNRQRQYSQPAPSQGSVDLNVENQQWQHSQPAPSQRSVDLNVENQQWQESQLAPSQRSVDLNVVNQQWQDSHLAPSQRSVDLNVVNQQWQDSQLAPSQRSVDLNVANQQWQDTQLAEPSQRSVDLNVANQPIREKQTGELVTENQDEQNRRLHAQLASYTFGDYWSDPCLEFAFKTLTGTLPVEENTPFQGSAHQEYNTSYSHADDGCFELPLFNTSSFYINDVPHHCAPSEEHIVKEQPPINHTFLPNGNNSVPGCSNVVTQNPGLAFFPNGNNCLPGYSNVSQNSGLDPHAKDYQSKFKSQR
ncbi:hypothetical protein P3S68_025965 [Capsicum galapagoense]